MPHSFNPKQFTNKEHVSNMLHELLSAGAGPTKSTVFELWMVAYPQDKNITVVQQFNRKGQIIPTEWLLHLSIFFDFCQRLGKLTHNLFTASKNSKLTIYISPSLCPVQWPGLKMHFSILGMIWLLNPFPFSPSYTEWSIKWRAPTASRWFSLFQCGSTKWYPHLLSLIVVEPLHLSLAWDLMKQLHMRRFQNALKILRLHTWNLSNNVSDRCFSATVVEKMSGCIWQSSDYVCKW